MGKIRAKYVRVWAVLFVLFNAAALVGTGLIRGFAAAAPTFFIALGAVELSLIAQLIFVLKGYQGETQRYFREKPLIRTSYFGLLLTAVAGAVFILLLPGWLTVVLAMALMVFECIALLNSAAGKTKESTHKEETEAAFLPMLAEKAEKLFSEAPTETVKNASQKVLEAIKTANPAQSPALAGIEAKITAAFAELLTSDDGSAPAAAEKVISLLRDRNNNCKLLK